MPDPNYGIAATVTPPSPVDPMKTMTALSQMQLSQAHAGLFQLQAQQQARQLQVHNFLQNGDIQSALAADPAMTKSFLEGGQLNRTQQAYATFGADAANGKPEAAAGLFAAGTPEAAVQATGMQNTRALTSQANAQTGHINSQTAGQLLTNSGKSLELRGQIAQQVFNNPGDTETWLGALADAKRAGFSIPDNLANAPVSERVRIAKAFVAAGQPPATFAEFSPGFEGERAAAKKVGEGLGNLGWTPPGLNANIPTAPAGDVTPAAPGAQIAQSGAPASPFDNRFVFGRPGALEEKQGDVAANKEMVKQNLEQSSKAYSASQALMERLPILQHNMDVLGDSWLGAGATDKLTVARGWNSFVDTIGGITGKPVNPNWKFDPAKVAAGEEFGKEQTRAGMELLNSYFGGSREAASIIQMGRAAVNGIENTKQGGQYIMATIKAAAQRSIDLHEFKMAYDGPMKGAEIAFNKLHPPQDYAFKAMAETIPEKYINDPQSGLLANPGQAKEFDAKFHVPGMANHILKLVVRPNGQ